MIRTLWGWWRNSRNSYRDPGLPTGGQCGCCCVPPTHVIWLIWQSPSVLCFLDHTIGKVQDDKKSAISCLVILFFIRTNVIQSISYGKFPPVLQKAKSWIWWLEQYSTRRSFAWVWQAWIHSLRCLSVGESELEFSFQNQRFPKKSAQQQTWAYDRLFRSFAAFMLELCNASLLCMVHVITQPAYTLNFLLESAKQKCRVFFVVTSCGINDGLCICKVDLKDCCLQLSFGVLGSGLFLKFIAHFDMTTLLEQPFWHHCTWQWQKLNILQPPCPQPWISNALGVLIAAEPEQQAFFLLVVFMWGLD